MTTCILTRSDLGPPAAPVIPAGGLSLTLWGDVCEYRGDGFYTVDAEGLLTLTGDRRHGLWLDAADIATD